MHQTTVSLFRLKRRKERKSLRFSTSNFTVTKAYGFSTLPGLAELNLWFSKAQEDLFCMFFFAPCWVIREARSLHLSSFAFPRLGTGITHISVAIVKFQGDDRLLLHFSFLLLLIPLCFLPLPPTQPRTRLLVCIPVLPTRQSTSPNKPRKGTS